MNFKPTMVTRISNVFGLCPYAESYQKFTPLLVKFGGVQAPAEMETSGFN